MFNKLKCKLTGGHDFEKPRFRLGQYFPVVDPVVSCKKCGEEKRIEQYLHTSLTFLALNYYEQNGVKKEQVSELLRKRRQERLLKMINGSK